MSAFDIILILLIIAILIVLWFYLKKINTSTKKQDTCNCNTNLCKSNSCALLPVTDPAFNLRETAKQMLLLEDHLSNTGKTCQQCIIKHSLTIEGYLEEALCLDCDNKYGTEINDLLDKFKAIEQKFLNGHDLKKLAQELRDLRKKIHVKYFSVGLI